MAKVLNNTFCNVTGTSHDGSRNHRCETELDKEASSKYGVNAGYYVIIVIIFYATSVGLLLGSNVRREHKKILEDNQINSYLKEFQVVQESSSRDSYKNLKRSMVSKLTRMGMLQEGQNRAVIKCLGKTVLPTTAIALPPKTYSFSKTSQTALGPIIEYKENEVVVTIPEHHRVPQNFHLGMTNTTEIIQSGGDFKARVHGGPNQITQGRSSSKISSQKQCSIYAMKTLPQALTVNAIEEHISTV